MKYVLIFILSSTALVLAHGDDGDDDCEAFLSIKRSTNMNEVVYEACSKDGVFLPHDPIHVHWLMVEKGNSIQELSDVEQRAGYGVVIDKSNQTEIIFHVKAISERELVVKRDPANSKLSAIITIRGEPAVLTKVFIKAKAGGLIPAVSYVELQGRAVKDQRILTERLVKK